MNEATTKIEMLKWPSKVKMFTFMRNSPFIKKEEIEEHMQQEKLIGTVEKPVNVGILDMRWFYNERKNFVAFSRQLYGETPLRYYSSQFMQCLLDQFWMEVRFHILTRTMLPYILFLVATGGYMYM